MIKSQKIPDRQTSDRPVTGLEILSFWGTRGATRVPRVPRDLHVTSPWPGPCPRRSVWNLSRTSPCVLCLPFVPVTNMCLVQSASIAFCFFLFCSWEGNVNTLILRGRQTQLSFNILFEMQLKSVEKQQLMTYARTFLDLMKKIIQVENAFLASEFRHFIFFLLTKLKKSFVGRLVSGLKKYFTFFPPCYFTL